MSLPSGMHPGEYEIRFKSMFCKFLFFCLIVIISFTVYASFVGFVSFIDGFWSVLSVIIGFGGMIILICKFLY